MPASILALLALIVEHGPQVTVDLFNEYATVAHGEGGAAKIVAALQGLAQIAEDATGVGTQTAAASAPTSTASAPTAAAAVVA